MIGILNYDSGNLGSVSNACRYLGMDAHIFSNADGLEDCRALIVPGVGAFGDCMKKLRARGFDRAICDWVAADRPVLGICIGLQVLFEGSEESPGVAGLGLLEGRIMRFPGGAGLKVPQMGWNGVTPSRSDGPLFEGLPDEFFCYFVHSYCAPESGEYVAATTEFGIRYASAIQKGNLFATQFHPEKSHRDGLRILRNFAAWSEIC